MAGSIGGITRRRFLTLAGAAAGALALPSTLLGFDSRLPAGRPLKVGAMLPVSRIYPRMGESYLNGMSLSFHMSSVNAVFLREEISQSIPYQKFKSLAENKEVDLITGLFNARVASVLSDLFPGGHVPFVTGSVGECIGADKKDRPSLFQSSLDYWKSNWAMGKWAARNLGNRAFVSASFYESGYDGIFAFRCGYESDGGRIVETRISDMPGAPEQADILKEAAALKPDFIYALYCGHKAAEFIKVYADSSLGGKVPLVGSPFFVDDSVLKMAGISAEGIRSCVSWDASLDTQESRDFVASYTTVVGREPDVFSLLGYEAGGLIATALGHSGVEEGLRRAVFSGPRGLLSFNEGSRSPVFLREVLLNAGKPVNKISSSIETADAGDSASSSLKAEVRTGWNNAYMCV